MKKPFNKTFLLFSLFISFSLLLVNLSYASVLMKEGDLAVNNLMKDRKATDEKIYRVALVQGDFVSKLFFQSLEHPLGFKFQFDEFQHFPDVLEAIASRSADFAANMTYTDERAKQFHVSSPTNIVLAYFYSKNIPFKEAKIIGTPQNNFFVKTAQNENLDISFVQYNTTEEAVKLLESKAIDGIVDTIYALEKYLNLGYHAEMINDRVSIPQSPLLLH